MKLTIQAHVLRDAINKVLTVVDKKNSRPILTNCLIKSQGQKLELIATDLEVSAKIILAAKIEKEGSFCINSKNRIVRRIFESLGYEVVKLDRVIFAGLTKKDLPRGRWRFLSEKEITMLNMIKK